jgi:hypothetical protein
MNRATHKNIIAQDRAMIKGKISIVIGLRRAAGGRGAGWGYAAG